jgi:hypothetical protein
VRPTWGRRERGGVGRAYARSCASSGSSAAANGLRAIFFWWGHWQVMLFCSVLRREDIQRRSGDPAPYAHGLERKSRRLGRVARISTTSAAALPISAMAARLMLATVSHDCPGSPPSPVSQQQDVPAAPSAADPLPSRAFCSRPSMSLSLSILSLCVHTRW